MRQGLTLCPFIRLLVQVAGERRSRVPQELLDDLDVFAFVAQERGQAPAERMPTHVLRHARRFDCGENAKRNSI